MGSYYSINYYEPEKDTVENVKLNTKNKIIHQNKITDEQFLKVIKYSKKHHYVRCNECLLLTNFAIFTGGGRFTHPLRETLKIEKDKISHEDIVHLDCKYCNNIICVKI